MISGALKYLRSLKNFVLIFVFKAIICACVLQSGVFQEGYLCFSRGVINFYCFYTSKYILMSFKFKTAQNS